MFLTENYSAALTILTFWAPALKSPAESGIPKKSLDTSLKCSFHKKITVFTKSYSQLWDKKTKVALVKMANIPLLV